jgi:queuine tRNA-ribosyltransferase/7-cyano-7-deazaguanine tRNA-ribosyltransferase
MKFHISKKSKISRARLGFMETSHGVVETPCLVPVATQAVIKTLTSEEAEKTGSQILICNTFHLYLKPGEGIVEKSGGLHKFMNWKKPLMTDSGGFQVFSLGFGKDFNIGKIGKTTEKPFTNSMELVNKVNSKSQPKNVKITQDGVYFRSPIDGRKLFLGPEESIKIQEKLGSDIIFTFDECTPPIADYEYTKKSLERTHQWAKVCFKVKKSVRLGSGQTKQALFGIVQGGKFKDLRQESAKFIANIDFDGFGIGGEFGDDKKQMPKMLNWVIDNLPEKKPRHLLGIGQLEDMEKIIKSGIDLFDCTIPTHYARRGILFGSEGRLNLKQQKFLKKQEPLDKNCVCDVCLKYNKNYICHLLRAGELTALKLITFHNLCYFNKFVEEIRNKIKKGEM